MADIPQAKDLVELAGILAPGLIILGIRSRFRDGTPADLKDKTINYGAVSVAYLAVSYPIFHADTWVQMPLWLWQLSLYFVWPFVIGVLVVYADNSEWFYKACKRLGLKPSHHIPAAWDYAFSNLRRGTYVLVRLNDGKEVAGLMGTKSFASSAREERDLLIQEVWKVPETGAWERLIPPRAVLLCGRDIRFVEFFHRG
jgi:hypothetical protein